MTTASIALRARAAAALITRARDLHPGRPSLGENRAHARIRLANLLGIDPAFTTADADPRRHHSVSEPLTLTATDPTNGTQYRLLLPDPHLDDEPLLLLGPCPACHAEVQLVEIHTIADLATPLPAITNPHAVPAPYADDTFTSDPMHRDHCPIGTRQPD